MTKFTEQNTDGFTSAQLDYANELFEERTEGLDPETDEDVFQHIGEKILAELSY